MTTLREAAEAVMEQLKGTWVSESDPVAQDLKAALAEPVQEPGAWISIDCIGERYLCFSKPLDNDPVQPLYTSPPQRKPLTDASIVAMWHQPVLALAALDFARAIERAHGIGGEA